jgi:hypothetical protein
MRYASSSINSAEYTPAKYIERKVVAGGCSKLQRSTHARMTGGFDRVFKAYRREQSRSINDFIFGNNKDERKFT